MAWVLGGLVYCFEDQVANLKTAVLHFSVEVLRYSLLVCCYLEIHLVSLFLDQVQLQLRSEGFFVPIVIIVFHMVGW